MSQQQLQFKFIGHATLIVESDNFSIITDPWFGEPFHHNSFYHNQAPVQIDQAQIDRINGIHISHIHQDHLNEESLRRFSREAPVYIAKHEDREFYDRIKNLGFRCIHEIEPWRETKQVGPFQIRIYTPEVFNGSFDSSLMIENLHQQFYVMNDCMLNSAELNQIGMNHSNIVGGFLGYVGAHPSPTCYDIHNCPEMGVTILELLRRRDKYYLNCAQNLIEKFNTKGAGLRQMIFSLKMPIDLCTIGYLNRL